MSLDVLAYDGRHRVEVDLAQIVLHVLVAQQLGARRILVYDKESGRVRFVLAVGLFGHGRRRRCRQLLILMVEVGGRVVLAVLVHDELVALLVVVLQYDLVVLVEHELALQELVETPAIAFVLKSIRCFTFIIIIIIMIVISLLGHVGDNAVLGNVERVAARVAHRVGHAIRIALDNEAVAEDERAHLARRVEHGGRVARTLDLDVRDDLFALMLMMARLLVHFANARLVVVAVRMRRALLGVRVAGG